MGKRELLLIVGFLIVGAVVYQATAPPPDPDDRGFSFSKLMDHVRREVRGNREVAELTTTVHHAITPDLTELRLLGRLAEVEVTGEDRVDVETTLYVNSRGYTQEEAKQSAAESKLVVDKAAAALILRMEFPRGGRLRGTLKVKVPSRLHLRVEPGPGQLRVSGVAGVELAGTRGEATIKNVAGRVEISHRGGPVIVEDAGAFDFNGGGGSLKLTGVRGDASIKMDHGERVTAAGLRGVVTLESRDTDVTLDNLDGTRGPIRVSAIGGTIVLKAVKSDTRVDGRNSEIDIAMSAPAQVAVYNEGKDVSLMPPPGGFTLDALVVDGRVQPESLVQEMGLKYVPAAESKETRATGPVNGGGPTITIRATRGDLVLRTRDANPPTQPKN